MFLQLYIHVAFFFMHDYVGVFASISAYNVNDFFCNGGTTKPGNKVGLNNNLTVNVYFRQLEVVVYTNIS